MAARLSLSRRNRLIRQLARAERTLAGWSVALARATSSDSGEAAAVASAHAMVHMISEARESVRRRLAELDTTSPAAAQSYSEERLSGAVRFYLRRRSLAGLCLRACRCCGRALGRAFRVAESVADLATARVLYGDLRAFEKQLWVLDPRAA